LFKRRIKHRAKITLKFLCREFLVCDLDHLFTFAHYSKLTCIINNMNKTFFTPKFLVITGIIILAAVLRLIEYLPNFSPIAAMALFAGTYLKRKELAFAVPVAALLISDIFLGFHQTMIAVYASFAIIVLLGFYLRRSTKVQNIFLASLVSSLIFFVITNFAVWVSGLVGYPMNFAGLTQCYVAAIPFFRNTLLGDLFYNAVFFGGFYLATLRYPALAR